MSNVIHLEIISDIHKMLPQFSVKHPLVAVLDFSKYQEQFNTGLKLTMGFYSVMFKNSCTNKLKYGQ